MAAIADGPASETVRSYLTTMGFDLSQYQPIADTLQAGDTVDLEQVRAIRLEYAKRLEADVAQLRNPR